MWILASFFLFLVTAVVSIIKGIFDAIGWGWFVAICVIALIVAIWLIYQVVVNRDGGYHHRNF